MLPQSASFVRWGEPSQGEILEADESLGVLPDLTIESDDTIHVAYPFHNKTRSTIKKAEIIDLRFGMFSRGYQVRLVLNRILGPIVDFFDKTRFQIGLALCHGLGLHKEALIFCCRAMSKFANLSK